MQLEQKRRLLIKIAETEAQIDQLKEVRQEILTSGYASATFSSGGGSKSYTHQDISKINETIDQLIKSLKNMKSLLIGKSNAMPTKIIQMYF